MTFEETVQIWGVAGTWVAALGTVGAVITSLCLAGRAGSPRFTARLDMFEIQVDDSPQQHVLLEVTNVGFMPVSLTGVRWVIGKRKGKTYSYKLPVDNSIMAEPMELSVGGQVVSSVLWSAEEVGGLYKDLGISGDKSLKTLKVEVITPRRTLCIKPRPRVIQYLQKQWSC